MSTKATAATSSNVEKLLEIQKQRKEFGTPRVSLTISDENKKRLKWGAGLLALAGVSTFGVVKYKNSKDEGARV